MRGIHVVGAVVVLGVDIWLAACGGSSGEAIGPVADPPSTPGAPTSTVTGEGVDPPLSAPVDGGEDTSTDSSVDSVQDSSPGADGSNVEDGGPPITSPSQWPGACSACTKASDYMATSCGGGGWGAFSDAAACCFRCPYECTNPPPTGSYSSCWGYDTDAGLDAGPDGGNAYECPRSARCGW